MPYDSQGNFYRVHNWEQDRIDDIEIVSDRHDEEDDNFAEGLSQCVLRDGRAALTDNLNAGNNKIQNLKTGTGTTDAVNKGQMDTAINTAKTTVTTAYQTYVANMLKSLYPVGSVYIGTQSTCPLASLISGSTWTLVSSGKALWTGNGSNGNSTIAAGLPNITGGFGKGCLMNWGADLNEGALYTATRSGRSAQDAGGTDSSSNRYIAFDASKSNSIYGNSTTVQPPAYVVNVWRRTA